MSFRFSRKQMRNNGASSPAKSKLLVYFQKPVLSFRFSRRFLRHCSRRFDRHETTQHFFVTASIQEAVQNHVYGASKDASRRRVAESQRENAGYLRHVKTGKEQR